MKKMMAILLIVFVVFGMMTTPVFAGDKADSSAYWQNEKDTSATKSNGSKVGFEPLSVDDTAIKGSGAGTTASMVLGAMQWIGYAIAVGMLIYIGIKYVMASADEKANLKNAMIRYIIGAVLIAGGVTIAGWIFSAFAQ